MSTLDYTKHYGYGDLIREIARALMTEHKTAQVAQYPAMRAAATLFTANTDVIADVPGRTDAWRKIVKDVKSITKDKPVRPDTLSMLKRVCIKDGTNQYLTPWAKADFTVPLRTAYDALADVPKTAKYSVETMLEQAGKKICKAHPKHLYNIKKVGVGHTLNLFR